MFLLIVYALIAAAFFFLVLLRQGLSLETMTVSVFLWLLIYFMATDLRYFRVPRRLAIFGISLGLMVGIWKGFAAFQEQALGAIFGFLSLWCILIVSTYILRKSSQISVNDFAMGSGDPWLLAVIGANMGVLILPAVLFLASIQGVLVFALSTTSKRLQFRIPFSYGRSNFVPFGAFLCIAALELAVWPDLMVEITSFIRSFN